ncbi:MAG: protein kinase [Archangium sp.]|nr:protein kinase [Archangium sp.]MDP3154678.1 protein kinase [Archangium sp.]MDP3572694.1 protein kinase [Archangium sp.]
MNEEHPSDEALAAWSTGSVPAEEVARLTEHVSGCDACRALLSALTGAEPPAANRVGRYELREKVGAGGMGTVWSAWDPRLSRRVAVKIAHARHTGSDARFLHERYVLGGLEHAHIARLLDGGETVDHRPWFAMDFVDGAPIDVYAEQHHLSVRARVELFLPVLAAVQHAHRHLVVHRDLKPANVLVDLEGQPRLVDFGIARLLERDLRLTQTGQQPMTPAFASPEQVRGEPITTASDVFSLGVVLYELLSGTSPWRTPPGDLEALLSAIRQTEPAPCSRSATTPARARALEGDLDAVLAMALRKEPGDRYASAQAFADDLRASLEGTGTLARRGDLRYRVTRFVRRHRLAVGAAVVVLASLGAGLVATASQARVAMEERDRAQRRFEQVRVLAHAVLFDYHDGIADLPGSTPLRERLVKDTIGYLDSLATEAQGDLTLQRELARAWLKVGDVQGDPFGSSLGQTDEARRSYERGQALAQVVLQRAPGDRDARRAVAMSDEKLGAIEEVSGQLESAIAAYQRAAALGLALASEQPDDAEQRFELSRVQLAIGQVRLQQNQLAQARTALEASLASRRAVLALRRTPLFVMGLGSTLNSVAGLLQQDGRNTDALRNWEEALSLFEEALAQEPLSAAAKRGRNTVLGSLAAGFIFEQQHARALELTTRALSLSRKELADDPQNAILSRDLAVMLMNHAQALSGVGRFDEALETIDEDLRVLEGLAKNDPTSLARRDLVIARLREGYVALDGKRVDRGLFAFQEVSRRATAMLAEDPANSTVEEWVADGHYGVASALRAQRHFAQALTELEASEAVFSRLLEREPDNARLVGRRAICLVEQGHVLIELRRREDGCARFRAALERFAALESKGQLIPAMNGPRDEARNSKGCSPL